MDSTIEERHLSLTTLLTETPGPQNTFDPVLMDFGMWAENGRLKIRKGKERSFSCCRKNQIGFYEQRQILVLANAFNLVHSK